jgi:hypothetical protein
MVRQDLTVAAEYPLYKWVLELVLCSILSMRLCLSNPLREVLLNYLIFQEDSVERTFTRYFIEMMWGSSHCEERACWSIAQEGREGREICLLLFTHTLITVQSLGRKSGCFVNIRQELLNDFWRKCLSFLVCCRYCWSFVGFFLQTRNVITKLQRINFMYISYVTWSF